MKYAFKIGYRGNGKYLGPTFNFLSCAFHFMSSVTLNLCKFYVFPINVFVLFSVPDSINYDLQAVEISEDSFLISWKVSSEMLLVVG